MIVTLTRELAFAASLDAGNRSMYAAGRATWDETDQAAAQESLTAYGLYANTRLIASAVAYVSQANS